MLRAGIRTTGLIGVVLLMVGCASIIHGTHQTVAISSAPPGATIADNGQLVGTTPATLELKRKNEHTIRITLDGYRPEEVHLTRQLSGWYIGNVLFGGLIGLVVDGVNGAMFNLTPSAVAATLTPEQKAALARGEVLVIALLEADPSWQKIGTMRLVDQ